MTRITVDPAMQAKLHNLQEPMELFDEKGRCLGRFSPASTLNGALYEDVEVPVTPEEVQRLLRQPAGRHLAGILADLEKQP